MVNIRKCCPRGTRGHSTAHNMMITLICTNNMTCQWHIQHATPNLSSLLIFQISFNEKFHILPLALMSHLNVKLIIFIYLLIYLLLTFFLISSNCAGVFRSAMVVWPTVSETQTTKMWSSTSLLLTLL